MTEPLWKPTPEETESTEMTRYMRSLTGKFDDYASMWEWSVTERADFWESIWTFGEVVRKVRFFCTKVQKSGRIGKW